MKRHAVGLALIAMAAGLWAPGPALGGMGTEKLLKPGDAAPAFAFSDLGSGAATAWEDLGPGQPLLVVFLQTACRACYGEMLTLKRLHQESDGFSVLGVFLDMKTKDFKAYIEENGLPFRFTWDAGYDIAEAYGVSFTPATFLLDRDRNVAAVYRGYHPGTEKALRGDLEGLLAGK